MCVSDLSSYYASRSHYIPDMISDRLCCCSHPEDRYSDSQKSRSNHVAKGPKEATIEYRIVEGSLSVPVLPYIKAFQVPLPGVPSFILIFIILLLSTYFKLLSAPHLLTQSKHALKSSSRFFLSR